MLKNRRIYHFINALPEILQVPVKTNIDQWLEELTNRNLTFPSSDKLTSSIAKVWGSSEFVAGTCQRNPELMVDLTESGDLEKAYPKNTYRHKLNALVITDENELRRQMRLFRKREMMRIAWRDLAGWAELPETLLDLSLLAETCIQFALDFHYEIACESRGTPLLKDGSPQQIVVLGMGKLGGYELNYSSDIDLIFAYPEEGVLPDRKETSYSEFFTRLCQKLVRTLDDITEDGFVFRTDIRLRPFGDSGPVIMTFDGMENYYLTQAREWERYAMIKARQVAGDFKQGAQLMTMLKPFVYRRYLDYGAFEELRSLKMQITQELKRKDRLENVKLGPGGIREVEFIGQVFQLIRGGKEKSLQTRSILEALQFIAKLNLLPQPVVDELIAAYYFLRRVENHIQEYQDSQTHDLPVDDKTQAALSFSLGYKSWTEFKTELDRVRAFVHSNFNQIFSVNRQDNNGSLGQIIWAYSSETEVLLTELSKLGFKSEETLKVIGDFKHSAAIRRMTAKGAGIIDRLMPQMLESAAQVDNPDETVKRLIKLFEAVAGRNVYLALLMENPGALNQLIRLASASVWLTEYLALYPILFDELLDTRSLYEPLKRESLDCQLQELAATIEIQDIELFMTALRQFKHLNVLRIAAADIMDVIKLMVVSDYLTYLAESITSCVVTRTWQMVTEKNGYPPGASDDAINFAVIGFGKLGGIELGYGSDLDLVFLYDCPDGNAMTNGANPITCAQFYGRLGLKVRHIFDTRLLSGVLYEVDMRLRPNGESGLLVAHISSYEDYHRNQAWTWEHQALVRGRFIAGDPMLKSRFETIRHVILSLPRDITKLKTEVRDMREKMRVALDTKESDKFDLKQSKGGIADIEFIVQFMVLAHAERYPDLTAYTDNVRQLESLAKHGLMTVAEADKLKTAYCTYRDLGHKQVLQGDNALIDEAAVDGLRADVECIWQRLMIDN